MEISEKNLKNTINLLDKFFQNVKIKSKVKESQILTLLDFGNNIKEAQMANISDIIEAFLLKAIGDNDRVNISRNELADYFACAPSQINYVLTTRFTLDRGYLIESRRGGGGYVTLIRLGERSEILSELSSLNISEGLSLTRTHRLIDRLINEGHLSLREGELFKAIVTDKALVAPGINKDNIRAAIIRSLAAEISKRGG